MLAIIIPYYKLSFFKATLESLASQTDKHFKVYIGDDASPEDCNSLLKNYKEKFDFEYHRFEKNMGGLSLTKHWERCMALSKGEDWLILLGDDDIIGNNVVEEFYKNLEEVEHNKFNVIRFASQKIDAQGKIISHVYNHLKIEKASCVLFSKTRSSLSEYVFRLNIVKAIGFKDFPLAWYSDVLAVIEFSKGEPVFSINNALFSIRLSEQSISGSALYEKQKRKAKFEFYYYLIDNRKQDFSENELEELYIRLQKCYLDDKKQLLFFLKISKLYFKNFKLKSYVLFLRQLLFLIKCKTNNETR